MYYYTNKKKTQIKEKIIEIVDNVYKKNNNICKRIELIELKYNNLLIFGEGNRINFTKFMDIVGISDTNNAGKTSLIDIILFSIYGKCPRTSIRYNILHKNANKYLTQITLKVNGKQYLIERKGILNRKSAGVYKSKS